MTKYGSKDVSFIANGTPATAVMDGEFLVITPSVDPAVLHVGGDGEGTMVVNADESATIAVTLKQTSPTNAVYSALRAAKAVFPVIVKDNSGISIHTGAKAFISGATVVSYGQAITGRVWTFSVAKLVDFSGGNPDV